MRLSFAKADLYRKSNLADHFVWIGIGLGIVYWILESFIHVLFFEKERFTEELITPDAHEIWKRILVIGLLLLFGLFAQQYFNLRRRSENAIKESERKYRTIFEEALNPIFLFENGGRIVDNNRAALNFLECGQAELLTKNFEDIANLRLPGENVGSSSLVEKRRILELDCSVNGRSKTLLLNVVPLNGETKTFVYGIGQDITDRKRMEHKLKQAHAELDQIFQTASVGMRVIDKDCNHIKLNKTFASMVGVPEDMAVGSKCYEIFSGPMCHTEECPINRILGGVKRYEINVDKLRQDGKNVPCILTATPFTGPSGEVIGIVESFRDIAQLKKAHDIIHAERDKLHRILSYLQEGVCIVNDDYIIEYHNDVIKKDFGACQGQNCYRIFREVSSPCRPCLMRDAIRSGNILHVEYERTDGSCYEHSYTRVTDIDGREKAIALIKDVTEKKANLAAAMHSEQLAAVGELAAGVAHEINNPLNGMINYAQIIKNKNEEGSLAADISGRIIKEGNRIARIVEGLLSFSRRRKEEKSAVSVKEILTDCLTLTKAQMRKDKIVLNVNLSENLPRVMAQPHQIEQVFINIINNSRYALNQKYPEDHDDKLLEISSQIFEHENRPYLRITFLDHGVGIPASIMDKIINPFFTTKTEGKRTGLGLSISHGIVENHQGRMTIESVEGRFARIHIDLPALLEKQRQGVTS